MYLFSVFLILLSFLQGATNPAAQATPNDLMEVERRFNAALLKKDDVVITELLADDLVHISFEGQAAGKTEYLAFFKQDVWRYLKYEPTNVAVKILGNVAVVTGRVDRTIVINNKETTGAFAYTNVWSRAGDRWRLTSSQRTTIPNP